ncbi:tRNA pseudouridine synthase B [Gracilibacillus halophilus YIM-C55.5]|uniref:tRNA pseudouridine synthase B n=1 Tax=Gracilibacillus halophilus YIM-C55.5 TaxID=1308866 RepID=N4WBC7_9BACI|nr:tRNA pseudouridine(55) synthase TruB [Gracilibacillus halophilus]ENH96544.1 tRNA pseudouridine synthase B [Gracilibacillus halophilus YIM-C55.5]
MEGILPVWKPKGYTSHDCVMKVRKWLGIKKIGHTGTLDPEVEGVLPLCIGKATKIVPFLTDVSKSYQASITLGIATETQDHTGSVTKIQHLEKPIANETIEEVIQQFHGEQKQQVPLYSAVKVNGKKLYQYARENIPVERPVRSIYISSIHVKDIHYHAGERTEHIGFDVTCSKGTYVRTLCVDIGKALGVPAHMSDLKRTEVGSFNKSNSIPLAEIEDHHQEITSYICPINMGIRHLPAISVDAETKRKVQYGQKLPVPDHLPETDYFRMLYQDEVLAIYQLHQNQTEIKPARVL